MLQPGPDLGLTGSKPDSLKRSSLSPPRISAATHTYWISVLPSKQASFQSQSQQKALEIATKGKAQAVLSASFWLGSECGKVRPTMTPLVSGGTPESRCQMGCRQSARPPGGHVI